MTVGASEPGRELSDALRVEFRVRFDEAGPDGVARSSALLRYAQECAWIHSEAVGLGREWYAAQGLTWVVRCIELRVVGAAGTGSSVEGSTRVVGFRRVWGRRLTEIRDAGGAPVAVVSSDWVMTDLQRGTPTRVPDDFPRAFGILPTAFEPHRVALPPTPATAVAIDLAVRPHELDPLAHANHAVYLDWLEEAVLAVPGGESILRSVPRTYRLMYLVPVTAGLALVGHAWPVDELAAEAGIAYRLQSGGRDHVRGLAQAGLPRGAAASGVGAR